MTEQEMKQIIIEALKKIAPDTEPDKLSPTDNIRQALEIDSFDYLQFIVAIDEKFGFETPEEDYGKISSIQDLTEYIKSHIRAFKESK